MSITFTGLAQGTCEELLRLAGPSAKVQILPAQAILQATKAQLPGRVVWLYRAPWALPEISGVAHATTGDVLSHWLATHRALLRKRRTLGKQLMLVNAEQVAPAAVLAALGLRPETAPATTTRLVAVTAFLSQVFESAMPELWDVFEALEVQAWRAASPDGVPAEIAMPSPQEGLQLFQLLLDGHAAPALKAALGDVQARAATQVDALQTELTQVRQQLEERNEQLATIEAQLVQERTGRTQQEAAHEEHLGRLQARALGLEEKLAAVTAELEQALAAEQAQASALVQAQQEFASARQAWREPLDTRDEALASVRHAVAQEQARVMTLEEENTQVWEQLHLVQEELECHFLEGRHLQEALNQSRHTLERARRLISGLIASRTTEVA